jgi:ferredoxin
VRRKKMSIKTEKPKIEVVISDVLTGDVLSSALSFITYLREHKINPGWSATNAWKISYRGFTVCFIRLYGAADYHGIEPNSWTVLPFIGEYEESLLSDEFKEIVWENRRKCGGCGQCALRVSSIFGKKYDYACEASILFTNPTSDDIECIKKMIELRRSDIKAGNAKKHVYIPMKDR